MRYPIIIYIQKRGFPSLVTQNFLHSNHEISNHLSLHKQRSQWPSRQRQGICASHSNQWLTQDPTKHSCCQIPTNHCSYLKQLFAELIFESHNQLIEELFQKVFRGLLLASSLHLGRYHEMMMQQPAQTYSKPAAPVLVSPFSKHSQTRSCITK